MGSTTTTKGDDVEFEVVIGPSGDVSYECGADDGVAVTGMMRAMEGGEKRRAPRVLPLADEILTPEEAAEHLGIPRKTIIFLCAEGRLAGAFKAGRRWRVPGRAVRKMAGVP